MVTLSCYIFGNLSDSLQKLSNFLGDMFCPSSMRLLSFSVRNANESASILA